MLVSAKYVQVLFKKPVALPSGTESNVEGSKPVVLVAFLLIHTIWIVPHTLLSLLRRKGCEYNPAAQYGTGERVWKMRLG